MPKEEKQVLAASAALSKAEHGWYHKLPAQSNIRMVEAAVDQLCEEPKHASPHLRKIFRNDRLDVQSRVLQNLVSGALRRMTKCRRYPW